MEQQLIELLDQHNAIMNKINEVLEDVDKGVDCKVIELDGTLLMVFKSGMIFRQLKYGSVWKLVENVSSDRSGYNKICVNRKMIMRHRIIALIIIAFRVD